MTKTPIWIALVCVMSGATGTAAQTVDTNPMSCWWRAGKGAVRIGEPFSLTLTCQVMETAAVTVVPTLTEIEPASIELTPFEVLEGMRQQDIVSAPWRFVQYVYTVRLQGDEFFGQDVSIPSTNVPFRVQTRSGETVEGNEHRYVLPPLPIRILSTVPGTATDIRDPAIDTFADLEARRFRAEVEMVAAAILFGFAAVLAVIAALRVRERLGTRDRVVDRPAAAHTMLGACEREVERVRAEALREGWTSHLAGEALAPFRVAGAIALKQPVAHTTVATDTPVREGQIAVRHGWLRKRHAMVSAPMTADAIDRLRTASNGHARRGTNDDTLDRIREALVALNMVRYGRAPAIDAAALNRVLDNGSAALRQLRKARWWSSWRG